MARKALTGLALVTVLAVASSGTAFADPGSPAAGSRPSPRPDKTEGEKFCQRAERVEVRLTKLSARLKADAGTKGSVANLKGRAAKLKAEHPRRAARLTQRAERREKRIPRIAFRLQMLDKVELWCGDHGFTTGS